MPIARRRFLQLAALAALPGWPPWPHAKRKAIRPSRCASSSAFRPAGRTTSSAASSRNGCRRSSASRSTSRTRAASPATSRPKRSCARRPTATPSCWSARRTRSAARSIRISSFNFLRDIVPVAGVTREPLVMVVHPSVPAKTVPEFLAYAKANPGAIKMASTGIGSSPHVTGELFKQMAGLPLDVVHYGGGGPALKAMIAGEAQMMFEPMSASIEPVRSGKLRALAVTTSERSAALPGVADRGRVGAGLRGERGHRHRRAEGHAGRGRRDAEQGGAGGVRRCRR